jgi:hypothetical protein
MTNVMNPNVMIFSAASEMAQKHYRETLDKGISVAQICDLIDDPETVYTLRDAFPDGVVYCWGGRSGGQDEHYFSLMAPGDLVLCYRDRRIVSYAYIVATLTSAKLGRFCWPDERVRPYDLVYFVSKPIDIDKPINQLSKYFGQMYQGLRRVAGTDDIIRDYGSLQNFVNDALLT